MGRRVDVRRTNPQMRVVRERSPCLRDRSRESRVCELGPSTHPHVQSHRGLTDYPQQRKQSLSVRHRRYAAAKLATGIQFIEVSGSDGDQQPLMWTQLFKWVEWQLPCTKNL
ncbi:hypothetical protein MRX96_024538 [Rhipicephalus microplus]